MKKLHESKRDLGWTHLKSNQLEVKPAHSEALSFVKQQTLRHIWHTQKPKVIALRLWSLCFVDGKEERNKYFPSKQKTKTQISYLLCLLVVIVGHWRAAARPHREAADGNRIGRSRELGTKLFLGALHRERNTRKKKFNTETNVCKYVLK